jgi:transposase
MATRKRKTFDPSLKLEVVRMIKEQGQSIQNVSESMSIGQTAIRRWLTQYGAEQSGQPGIDKPLTAEQQRIRSIPPAWSAPVARPGVRQSARPIPPAIIDGGMAAPGLLAWVAVSKYTDHLPLYRIVDRQGWRRVAALERAAGRTAQAAALFARRRDTGAAT